MLAVEQRWQRVGTIDSSGNYYFASDLNLPRSAQKLLPNKELPSDNVFGLRPEFEDLIADSLKQEFPEIKAVDFYPRKTIEFRSPIPQMVISEWRKESTTIINKTEAVRFFSHVHGFDAGLDIVRLSLEDVGLPYLDNKDQIVRPYASGGRNGRLELDLSGCGKRADLLRGEYWRGTLKLSGDKYGSIINCALDRIRETIFKEDIPLWKEIEDR